MHLAWSAYLLIKLHALNEKLGACNPAEAEATRDDLAERVHTNYTAIHIHREERAQGLDTACKHRKIITISRAIVKQGVSAPHW